MSSSTNLCLIALVLLLFQSTSAEGVCDTGDVRLVDGDREYEGRVEICYDGVWGTVCDGSINGGVATVVCTQLGLPLYDPKIYEFGGGTGPIFLDSVNCVGNETNLLQCYHNGIEVHDCFHYEDVGVSCAPPCNESEVRLLRNRVQICHNNVWGYVCEDDGWSNNDARVVCRELGFSPQDAQGSYYISYVEFFPYFLSYGNCMGSEEHLNDCPHSGLEDTFCFYIAVAFCREFDPCIEEGAVRLTHSDVDYFGRLEVCYDGNWGSVCDDFANTSIAAVVCRQLGYDENGQVFSLYQFDAILPNIPILLDEVQCSGNEMSLLQCSHNGVNNHNCIHDEDIVIECPVPVRECNETDVRLVDGRTSLDGKVEICINGLWGSVCDDKWDYRDAAVVCRQLGYSGTSYGLREFGGNQNVISFHLDDVHCNGNETNLVECTYPEVGMHNCRPGVDEAGVICTDTRCVEGTVHLVGGHNVKEGRVQICYNGEWHSVCGDRWSSAEADVVCANLGYSAELVSVKASFGRDASPILPRDIHCSGDEVTLSNCSDIEYDPMECQQVAGVICEAPCLSNNIGDCNECSTPSDCHSTAASCYCNAECYTFGHCCPDVGFLQNCFSSDEECVTGNIRLVGGVVNSSSGLLEVCANGRWGTVCDYQNEWTHENTAVVCRQLNIPTSSARTLPFSVFPISSHPIILDDVHCIGTEDMLLECSHASIGNHLCGLEDSLNISIQCKADCVDGEVRLQDGTHPSNGRVEICQNGIWGSVCSSHWDQNDAIVACRQLGYDSEDAEVTNVFGPGGPVLLRDVQCTGKEEKLHLCPNISIVGHSCDKKNTAGVICTRDFDASRKCTDEAGTPPGSQDKIVNIERFGMCEPYRGNVEICNGIFTAGVDYVFIPRTHGSQENISKFLEQNVLTTLISQDSGGSCYAQIIRVICNYYLSPCGTESSQVPPYSICPEDCSAVEMECPGGWQTAKFGLKEYQFINCDDTSAFLFPLLTCCTGAGLQHTLSTEGSDTSNGGGTIAGAVLGSLALIGAIILLVVSIYLFFKWRAKRRLKNLQMDIFAIPGSRTAAYYTDTVARNAGAPGVFEMSSHFMHTDSALPNPYSRTGPASSGPQVSLNDAMVNRTRVDTNILRELSCGKFLIKYEQLTQLESIGQGEFGIVYRAKLGPHGRSSQEVAVKTLKGNFDQMEVDKFVEESLKMSRFKHAHVMGLIGVCLDAGPAPYIVMPYMANGSLLQYLKRERQNLVLTESADEDEILDVRKRLMVMCSQIASGMEYLAREKYVHRDLAARNCMIDSHFMIKITDFGLSEDVFVKNYFRQGGDEEVVKLPVKWMAPESLNDGHFSEKSDVWSYGVTMWEIFSGGKAPYPGTDPVTLIQKLEEGDRMPKPNNAACTEEIYVIMRKCWETTPDDRPPFDELYKNTSKYIEHMAGYLDMGFNPFARNKSAADPKGEFESGVTINVIPASFDSSQGHTIFTNTTATA